MDWPNNRHFAFTVFDDTDCATLENISPIYEFLTDQGFRITKSVWPLTGTEINPTAGVTCDDEKYVQWLLELKQRGHEIGYHMATWHTSGRQRTGQALARIEQLFGGPPRAMANHAQCEENIYWGSRRLSGWRKLVYDAVTLSRYRNRFRGDREGDPLFWGDLCREKIDYVRGFVFPEINTLKVCPFMPYHDERRPFVNNWFASSEGANLVSYNDLLSEANQDRLEAEGGACIVYTHFGSGFCRNAIIDARFKSLMIRLSRKSGWFVPVSELLDFLKEGESGHVITGRERARMERQWLRVKLLKGRS